MNTRVIGIDLAITAEHRAAILNPATNEFVVKQMRFRAFPDELDKLLARARQGAGADVRVVVVLEATGMAWHPVGLYCQRQGAEVFRVNGRKTKELRRVHHPHARSDSIDSQVLARLWVTAPERLDPFYLPTGEALALQRACREAARHRDEATAIENRLTAYEGWAWAGLAGLVPAAALPWVRIQWYDPWAVTQAGIAVLTTAWRATGGDDATWIPAWLERAHQMTRLFGTPDAVDYPALYATIQRNLDRYTALLEQQAWLQSTIIQPLYRKLYPTCPLESIYGIGADSAAIYMAFIHSIDRFANVAGFRQWCGMVPGSDQSGTASAKGIHITQAGPDLIKSTLYLNANVARQWDPQLARVYYTQMQHYGKHHTQAMCACASHLANRIYAVLKANRHYVLRDLDGAPISATGAHQLIRDHFTVAPEVRRRTNVRARHVPAPDTTHVP